MSKLSKSPVPFKTKKLVHESLLIPNRSSKVGWSCVFEFLFCFPFLFRFLFGTVASSTLLNELLGASAGAS